ERSKQQYQDLKVEEDVIPMRDALLEYMALSEEELGYYAKMAEESKNEQLTEDKLEVYYMAIDSINAKKDLVEEMLAEAQKEFAKKHHITSYAL
ncbi:MAG: hypothetical protein ACRCVU_20975, partial [Flavobacterium sp.]